MFERSRLIIVLKALFQSSRTEDELDEEMRFHLKMETEANVKKGMDLKAAHQAALRSFGGIEQRKEDCREAWGVRVITNLLHEFCLSLRRLFRRPVQNGLMFATFAVSVMLSTLSWSLFHTMFLRQPEFDPKGEYLVLNYVGGVIGASRSSNGEMEAYKEGQKVFSDFAEVGFYNSPTIQLPGGAERVLAANLSARALQIVGAKPLMGRLFRPEEDKRGSAPVALLSQHMWENSYDRDPSIVGKIMDIGSDQVTIVGVMPADFRFPNDQDLWLSYGFYDWGPDAMVKLKPGVTREQAESNLKVILDGLGPDSPANRRGLTPALIPFRDYYLPSEIRVSALVLFALSLIFVVVSCANAANLMLIDFLGRRAEVATSLALGIPRGASIRNVCFQVTMIAMGAVLLSIALLPVAGPFLYDHIDVNLEPYWLNYHFEWHYVGMAFALAGVSAAVTVSAPMVYLLWVDPDKVIREHAYTSRGTGRTLWRRLLLIGQITLLTVLGVSAGLLVRSSYNVGENTWGYPADRVFVGKISAREIEFTVEEPLGSVQRLAIYRRVLDQVTQRLETEAVALAHFSPGYSSGPNITYALGQEEIGEAFNSQVTEGFFDTLGVPFVEGNTLPRENPDDGPVYGVINESLAQKIWPSQDPLQRVLYIRFSGAPASAPSIPIVVCGVVRDFQVSGPVARNNDFILTPLMPRSFVRPGQFIFVRDRIGVPNVRSIRDAVHRADSRLSFYFPSTLGRVIDIMLSSMHMTANLTTVFAAAAVLLCSIGVYSLTVTQVLQSSREFGIRMALGTEPQRLWVHFTCGHLLTTLIGVLIGLFGASQVARVFSPLLFGVDPYSVSTYAMVAFTILLVATLACIPSFFRLRRINPAKCLRSL